jgi:uncharacterized protein (UPF0548 family)
MQTTQEVDDAGAVWLDITVYSRAAVALDGPEIKFH